MGYLPIFSRVAHTKRLQRNALSRRKSVAKIRRRYDCRQKWATFRQQLSLKRVLIDVQSVRFPVGGLRTKADLFPLSR